MKLDRGKSFVDGHGLVKDIHVTEFQTAIDELLRKARANDSESVIDAAKLVVVSVRRITHDAKVPRSDGQDSARQRAKLRGEVSSATNSLITTSMNYASGAGTYPLSLLHAAASRLAGAIADFLRLVKVQTTLAEDLEDDDGTVNPVDSNSSLTPVGTEQGSTTQHAGAPESAHSPTLSATTLSDHPQSPTLATSQCPRSALHQTESSSGMPVGTKM